MYHGQLVQWSDRRKALPWRNVASPHADMLCSLAATVSVAAESARDGEVARRPRQIVVSTLQLLQVLVVDQALVPQMLEETEVGSAGVERLAAVEVFVGDVVHPAVPGYDAIIAAVFPVAQRAPDRQWWLLAVKVGGAVGVPFLQVRRDVGALEEPEDAFVDWGAALVLRSHEHAVVLLEQRHAREDARQPCADGRLGGRGGLGKVGQ